MGIFTMIQSPSVRACLKCTKLLPYAQLPVLLRLHFTCVQLKLKHRGKLAKNYNNNIQVRSKNLFAPADFHLSIADIILRQLHSHEL